VEALREGRYNVLVATCIAEEGLDIGDVDLIVHYDVISNTTRQVGNNSRTDSLQIFTFTHTATTHQAVSHQAHQASAKPLPDACLPSLLNLSGAA
jgi:ERCC4-related helicase